MNLKKIYRLLDEKMVAGICGGIADMIGVDATIVRLGFVFLTVITGFVPGIITYAVGWVIIPQMTKDQVGK